MSIAQRRRKKVLALIEELAADGLESFCPGDLVSRLRERNDPLGTWEVRGVLAELEAAGLVEADPDSACWHLPAQRCRKTG